MSYQKTLNELASLVHIDNAPELLITDLCLDSRQVGEGSLFLAYPGVNNDGRDFIAAAIDQGAAAVFYEAFGNPAVEGLSIPAFAVSGLQRKVGLLADCFFSSPSQDLQVFGVTGTNGKTTCAYLLAQAFDLLGLKSGFIGTIGAGGLGNISASTHTTPDAVSLQRTLAGLRDEGVTQVCMEVSSHALHQARVAGTNFFAVAFTNLTQDHLDYHATMEDYGAAKAKLFTEFDSTLALINADDEFGQELIERATAEFVVSYGQQSGDLRVEEVQSSTHGLSLSLTSDGLDIELDSKLVGAVNVPNLLLVTAALLGLSTPLEDILAVVAKLNPAPGRMELFTKSGRAQVVVDYAHTPDALAKAIESVRHHCKGKLWCLFGCGGDRDQAKRPLMGAVAANDADYVIVTNDNPRSESPDEIADQIIAGMPTNSAHVSVQLDRKLAIEKAIANAAAEDWVLVAGKGHEETQTIGDLVVAFSDREIVKDTLAQQEGAI
ncbi:MAG: UDP-N-acetylmuramoyl-L-alanyl-D-glutamate--2,6-diaminopimelate ligase [Pseudomonadota bacterium]